MKLSAVLAFTVAIAITPVIGQAREPRALIELNYQIVGPAWKTWSLRLESNGKIVEERYDWSSNDYHSIKVHCKLKSADLARVIEASRDSLMSLPKIIDAGSPAPIDGPNKQLLVQQGAGIKSSIWYISGGSNPSAEARAFAESWDKIQGLLTCSSTK